MILLLLTFLGGGGGLLLEKFVELEEFAAEGAAVGGPWVFARTGGEGGTDCGHLGIEIVDVVEDQGFANHGEFWGAEFVLAVMADEQVLHDGFERRGKSGDGVDGAGDGFEFHDDVAEELAFGGVADGAFVAEFVEFADVVKHGGGEEQVDDRARR